jgi:hypothetical protein
MFHSSDPLHFNYFILLPMNQLGKQTHSTTRPTRIWPGWHLGVAFLFHIIHIYVQFTSSFLYQAQKSLVILKVKKQSDNSFTVCISRPTKNGSEENADVSFPVNWWLGMQKRMNITRYFVLPSPALLTSLNRLFPYILFIEHVFNDQASIIMINVKCKVYHSLPSTIHFLNYWGCGKYL